MTQNKWYFLSQDQVLSHFQTNPKTGLTSKQVDDYRTQYGLNEMTMKKGKSALLRFWLQIHQPLIYVLLISATIALYFGEYVDASVIYGVVVVNAVMGFVQEDKALKALDSLSKSITVKTHVIRDNDVLEIDSKDVQSATTIHEPMPRERDAHCQYQLDKPPKRDAQQP